MNRSGRAGSRGFALLITLWLLVPMSILFLSLTGSARSDGQIAANLRDAAVLRAAATGGVEPASAEDLAAAIVEWRTPGQQRAAGSSKAALYRAAGLDYGPPGAPFETIGELGDVLGMTPAILARLRPALSLFTDAPPNPALALPLVRSALADLGSLGRGIGGRGAVFHIRASASRGRALSAVRTTLTP